MAKGDHAPKQKRTLRARAFAEELAGFPDRLQLAVATRLREDPDLTQNAIAREAQMNGGNLTALLNGTKARGVTASTIIFLARALRVRPIWLMTGEEPSGLSSPIRDPSVLPGAPTPLPESELRRSSSRP